MSLHAKPAVTVTASPALCKLICNMLCPQAGEGVHYHQNQGDGGTGGDQGMPGRESKSF